MAAVWFITGVSSGFGTEIALQALASGQRVIGTVRNRTRAASQVSAIEDKGGKILELDVTDAAACSTVLKEAESLYGQVDVLVNNAGYGLLGAVEDLG
jgi:NADP-dependent 3-hydroxy acid dehydrogenase YdfG